MKACNRGKLPQALRDMAKAKLLEVQSPAVQSPGLRHHACRRIIGEMRQCSRRIESIESYLSLDALLPPMSVV